VGYFILSHPVVSWDSNWFWCYRFIYIM